MLLQSIPFFSSQVHTESLSVVFFRATLFFLFPTRYSNSSCRCLSHVICIKMFRGRACQTPKKAMGTIVDDCDPCLSAVSLPAISCRQRKRPASASSQFEQPCKKFKAMSEPSSKVVRLFNFMDRFINEARSLSQPESDDMNYYWKAGVSVTVSSC